MIFLYIYQFKKLVSQTDSKERKKETENMMSNRNTRRLSLDMFQRTNIPNDKGIFRYMDLRFPTHTDSATDINEINCECCGLTEHCSKAYIQMTRARFYGKWVCGLCSEAVNEESYKLGGIRNLVREDALNAHLKVCRSFSKTISNPAMSLAYAMTRILRTRSSPRNM